MAGKHTRNLVAGGNHEPQQATSHRRGAVALIALLALAAAGCGGGGGGGSSAPPSPPTATMPPPPAEEGFDTTAMLTNLADNVIATNYAALSETASAFAGDGGPMASLCAAIGGIDEESARATAQEGWRDAMAKVQATEMHVIGPALANGEALRHRLLSFSAGPISTCGIDQSAALVADGNSEFDITNRSLNQRGFGAIEYLLFNEELSHSCASQVPSTAGWNALDESARRLARCDLALAIAVDAAQAAQAIAEQWGGYREEFVSEGNTGDSLQLVTDALFAVDTLVKDAKLGIPAGIHDSCSDFACPDGVESRYARNSLANVRANTEAFLDLFNGADGSGFDDLIVEEGFPEVSDRFASNAQAVNQAIDRAPNALFDELAAIDSTAEATACMNAFAEPDSGEPGDGFQGCRISGLLKRITDDLKIDFVTIVEVDIPGSAQADND